MRGRDKGGKSYSDNEGGGGGGQGREVTVTMRGRDKGGRSPTQFPHSLK